jgi:hypothetical protein
VSRQAKKTNQFQQDNVFITKIGASSQTWGDIHPITWENPMTQEKPISDQLDTEGDADDANR